MSKMRTYILNKGHAQHRQNGNMYSEGDAINTCLDLVRMFPRKFSVAPQGINDERWPSDVVDVRVNGAYSVTVNFNGSTFRVVGPDGKPVAGFASVSRNVAFAKYRELVGKDAQKAAKTEPPKKPAKEEDDDEGDEGDGDEDEPKSKKSKKSDEDEDGDEDEGDGDGDGDDEDDEDDEPKSKKSKKSKKDDDDEDEDDEPKKKSKKSKK